MGLLFKIIWSGPTHIKSILELDERKSFSKIQTELFVRYWAKQELERALDTSKKSYKPIGELIFFKILKNNANDTVKSWKRRIEMIKTKLVKKS